VFTRIGALLGEDRWSDLAAKAGSLVDRKARAKAHAAFAADVHAQTTEAVSAIVKLNGADPFRLRASAKALGEGLSGRDVARRQSLHGSLLERLDASLTMLAKRRGDAADIPQNARWQSELLTEDELRGLRNAKVVAEACAAFDVGVASRTTTVEEYPELVERLVPVLRAAARKLRDRQLTTSVGDLDPRTDLVALQRLHRDVLLRLDALVRPAE
jgi:hypothetical protein